MYQVIGKRTPQINSVDKVTGAAKFSPDIRLTRMLYGKTLKSTHPHARIVKIHTHKARKLPGVMAIITGADIPNNEHIVGSYGAGDFSVLTTDKVRFIGDEIAAVAAVDEETADAAVALIEVEYELLPATFTVEDALKPGTYPIHEKKAESRQVVAGDVARGLAEADYVLEETFKTQTMEHVPPETESVVAEYDGSLMRVWAGTQVPYWDRVILSRIFDLPMSRVRVMVPFNGAPMGGRDIYRFLFIGAALAWKTRRTVRMVRNREEEFTCTTVRQSYNFHMKFGVKRNGKLTAMSCETTIDAGAYISWAHSLGQSQGHLFSSIYKNPNIRYIYTPVYTNNCYGGPMRGFGNAEVNFAIESMMDMIAEKLNMDPVQLRLKNAIEPNYKTPIGWKIRGCALKECIQRADEEIKKGFTPRADPKKVRGIGLACGVHWSGWRVGFNSIVRRTGYSTPEEVYNQNPHSPYITVKDGKVRWRLGFSDVQQVMDSDASSSIVVVNEDGSLIIHPSEPDMGQGSYTVLAMIAAEELGVKLENIQVRSLDTDSGTFGWGAYASRTTFVAGRAVQDAAREAKKALAKIASESLGTAPEELEFRDERIYTKSDPNTYVSFADAAFRSYSARGGKVLIYKGSCDPDSIVPDDMGHGSIAEAYAFIALWLIPPTP
ncbi:xanthine dehydrogenase family protein molybdopterin-binding subunit [Chloroflexota bacterium]